MSTEQKAPERASMNVVVMKKAALLEKLIENKAKHDALLEASIHGYWELAKTRIESSEKNFYEKLAEYKADAEHEFAKVKQKLEKKETLPSSLTISAIAVSTHLGLTYPEDHSKDYDRAIEMMRATVYDEVVLSLQEFDAYVMNEWHWKGSFVSNALSYTSALNSNQIYVTGCYVPVMSGCSAPIGTGLAIDLYNDARTKAWNAIGSGTFRM